MIVVDANYFLRYLVQPVTPQQIAMAETARALFASVQRGKTEATTSEVVLHEVIYVLASKRHYNLPTAEIASMMALLLRLPGFKFPRGEKRVYLHALELFSTYPRLGFADAVVAARVIKSGSPLATFDSDFDEIPGVSVWREE
jgi:predicted nucleic acid-binding protein